MGYQVEAGDKDISKICIGNLRFCSSKQKLWTYRWNIQLLCDRLKMPNNIRDPEKNFFPLIFGSISKILASLKSKYHGRQGLGMSTQWLRLSCCFANCIGWSILQMRFFIFDGNIIRHKPLALCCFHVSFDFIFTTFMVFLQTISLFSLSLPTRSLVAANRVNFCLLRFSSKP